MTRIWPWVVRFAGLAMIVDQAVLQKADRPYLIGAALLMMAGVDALAAYFDQKRK
jgi:hypothetical protein